MLDENYNCLINLEKSKFNNFADKVIFNNITFSIKSEFHITLIGGKIGNKIENLVFKYPNIKEFINNELALFSWNISYIDEFYIIKKLKPEKEYEYSIIQIVECPDLIKLYNHLNKNFPELLLDLPFPHVTLYTFNSEKGIAIYSKDDFKKMKQDKLVKDQLMN